MFKGVFLRTFGNYDADLVSAECGLVISEDEVCLVQQQFKDECDINNIMEKFGQTGLLPQSNRMPMSGDFTGVNDFQSAMQAVRQAEEAFMALPAQLRKRFEHDPNRLMVFLEDEANREEAIKLGLVEAPPEKTRDVVAAIDELRADLKAVPRQHPN